MKGLERCAPIALVCCLLAGDALARPGGGSSFRSSSSSSFYGSSRSSSSSFSSSRSSWGSSSSSSYSRPSRSGSSSGAYVPSAPAVPQIVHVDISYAIRRPQERKDGVAAWKPGRLGPYGEGPRRPARFEVEKVEEMTPLEALGWAGGFLLGGLALVIFLLWRFVRFLDRHATGWSTAVDRAMARMDQAVKGLTPRTVRASAPVRSQLEAIRSLDPDFSVVLLEDFLYALYAEAQTARGEGALDRLAHHLSPAARAQLDSRGPFPVHGIVVGAMRFVSFSTMPRLVLAVEIEANYAEDHRDGRVGFYTKEHWSLSRSPTARSRPPEKTRVFGCPTCGAPLDKVLGGTCQYCNRPVDQDADDWLVESIEVLESGERGPMLTGTVEEEGTGLPTVEDPGLPQTLARLLGKDPSFDVENLGARVIHIFHVMQKAWSSLQWEMARPFLSDNLFEAQSYWIAAYRAQGLRNVTENANVTRLELVRITQDRWFDAVTVRIHAGSIDYTLRDSDGQLVGGDRSRTRRYTEYWTLIRGAGRKGQARADMTCPSCGASFEAAMAAICKHCHAKVNSGAFDWVLSRIEQDEVYEG